MSGSLRTAREGKSPAESGIPVPTVGINFDTETGSPVLDKRGASSPSAAGHGSSSVDISTLWKRHVV
ncbi:hypothetical protein [Haloquadratum walsbyi]|uniref:Uncharacterized protein n=1 Tax=Haloquadratum walsbyi J07HQW2 TaxID=1238425 RepID=U1PSF3_9EURY|nr:hypothetical protein [Haloquadratum walsbyi]ERG96732.1 MAG: hypothetical protein J07HQW2_03215 [Haloquadratum walsbyi J07HQW2]